MAFGQKVKFEDMKFVNGEIQKLFKSQYKDFTEWEEQFLKNVNDIISLDQALSEKQIYWLYRAYFKHVEGDIDELENWCREYGLMHLYTQYGTQHTS